MGKFSFHPELFEERARVQDALSEAGIEWLSHYSSVDPIHDRFGLEICGIRHKGDAESIARLLAAMYPGWMLGKLWHKDHGREPGWKIAIRRDPADPDSRRDAV